MKIHRWFAPLPMLLRTSIHTRGAASASRLTPTDSSCLFFEALDSDRKLRLRKKNEAVETLYPKVNVHFHSMEPTLKNNHHGRYIVSLSTLLSQEVSWRFTMRLW